MRDKVQEFMDSVKACLKPELAMEVDMLADIGTQILNQRVEFGMKEKEFADYLEITPSELDEYIYGQRDLTIRELSRLMTKLKLRASLTFSPL